MNADFNQGTIDCTYIQLTPNRENVESVPIERLSWPQYCQAEQHAESPFLEADVRRSMHPKEIKTTYGGDARF